MSDAQIETIKEEAAAAAEQGKDLRALVRDMTLRALSRRSLSVTDIMAVVRAVTEGVSLGLGRRAGELKDAAHEALAGLDEAVKKTAEATKLAALDMTQRLTLLASGILAGMSDALHEKALSGEKKAR